MSLYSDYDHIHSTLYQGSAPPVGKTLRALGFDVVVLCAEEYQLRAENFPGLKVILAPMADSPVVPAIVAHNAADSVARYLKKGKRVLSTCTMGWNRSGLVSALALIEITGLSGRECADIVIKNRENALGNYDFLTYLQSLERTNNARTILRPGRKRRSGQAIQD